MENTSKASQSDESKIAENWVEKKSKNDRLYNNSKFRLASSMIEKNTDENIDIFVLNIGITDYKVTIQYINVFMHFNLHFLIQQLIRFITDSICLQDMLGTHYGCLSEILVHEAKSILQHQNTSSQGNISRKTLTDFTRNYNEL